MAGTKKSRTHARAVRDAQELILHDLADFHWFESLASPGPLCQVLRSTAGCVQKEERELERLREQERIRAGKELLAAKKLEGRPAAQAQPGRAAAGEEGGGTSQGEDPAQAR